MVWFSFTEETDAMAACRQRLDDIGAGRPPTQPALSDQRVQLNAAEQVELKRKTPWREGTTHLVMSPLEFMQRLAAPVLEERPLVAQAAAAVTPHPFGVR